MYANRRRIFLILAVVICVGVPLYQAFAFDINDIINENTTEETNSEVCQSQRIQDGLRKIQAGYLKQLVRDVINELKDSLVSYAIAYAICRFDVDVTEGGSLGATLEFTEEGVSCDHDLGGAMSSAFKRATLDKIKNDFTATCIADGVRKQSEDDTRRIILENGPDGGPAYVTNYRDEVYINERQRGTRVFCALLANTNVCPYMAASVYDAFPECPRSYFEEPPDLTGLGASVDGGDSFLQRAACTLPDDFTPELLDYDFSKYGGFDMLYLQQQPQNEPVGFIQMAEDELENQQELAVDAAELEVSAGGGFWSLYGSAVASCLNRDRNFFCLAKGPIRQPSGAVRDGNAAAIQAEFNWIVNSKQMNQLGGDVRRRLSSMLLTMDEMPLSYETDFDGSSQEYRDIADGTRQPDQVSLPEDPDATGQQGPPDADGDGQPDSVECPTRPCRDTDGDGTPDSSDTDSDGDGLPDTDDVDLNNDGIPDLPLPITDPNDPLCTGGNPDCYCARNLPRFDLQRRLVGEATKAATIANNELVLPPGCIGAECFVIPGSEVLFLTAVCDTNVGRGLFCHPNAGSVDEVVVGSVDTVSIDIIIGGSNQVRVPGQSVAACKAGVQ